MPFQGNPPFSRAVQRQKHSCTSLQGSHWPHSFFLQVAKTPASLSPLNPCDSGTPHKTAHELAKLPAVWNANHEAWRTARKSELEASFAGVLVHCIALAFCVKQALFCVDKGYLKSVLDLLTLLRDALPESHNPKAISECFSVSGCTWPDLDVHKLLRSTACFFCRFGTLCLTERHRLAQMLNAQC